MSPRACPAAPSGRHPASRRRRPTARAAYALAQPNRGKVELRAPIAGVVLPRDVEPGQVVVSALLAAGLFRVAADLSRLQVRPRVDEADVGRLPEGMRATFAVGAAPDGVYAARLRALAPAPRRLQQVVTYEALRDVDKPDGALRPGMTATVHVQIGRLEDAVLVPLSALRFEPRSARAEEIMRLLVDLHRQRGITLVMVTHEPDMAAFARRVLRFRDGRAVAVVAGHAPGDDGVVDDLAPLSVPP